MANTIRIKRRAAGGAAGAPTSLANAELAFNEQDSTLYYGVGTGGAGGTATSIIAIGGPGTFAPLASPTFTGTPSAPTAAVNTNTTQIATTAFVLGQANSTAGTITMNGTQAAGTSNLYARADHVHPSDTTKANLASPTFTGTPAAPTAAVDTNTTQLATTAFVLAQASSTTPATLGSAAVGTSTRYARADHVHAMPTFSQLGTATADVSLGGFKITNLADPTSAQDAATKLYVDNVAQGLDAKQSVKAATTGNIALTGSQTIDGITVTTNDRVLVKNQSTASQNGLYVASTGAWTRTSDMNLWTEVPNAFVFVEEGTTQADTSWVVTANQGGTIDTTAITWVQFGAANSYSAGNGLSLAGNVFSVLADGSTITVSASGVKVSDTYPGNTSLVTLGTVTTGTWSATTIAANKGGTGQTAYAVGDLLYADTTSTLAKLADVATGSALISGGVSTAPSWGKIGLATHVSGTLPATNGGTGQSSYAVGDLLYADTTTSVAKLADVATGNVLISGGVGTAPSYGKVGLTTHVSGTLGVSNGGTGAATFTAGYLKASGTTAFTTVSAIPTSDLSGQVSVANGGTGAATLTGYVYGNGTSAMTASTTIPNTAITGLGTMSTQNASGVAITGGSIINLTTFDGITIDGGTF